MYVQGSPCFSILQVMKMGTLYSVDPRTQDWGPGDPDPNWHTLYVYIHITSIVHT